jgi:hypothetical protein
MAMYENNFENATADHSSIHILPMNGLRRNDVAMKNRSWKQKNLR